MQSFRHPHGPQPGRRRVRSSLGSRPSSTRGGLLRRVMGIILVLGILSLASSCMTLPKTGGASILDSPGQTPPPPEQAPDSTQDGIAAVNAGRQDPLVWILEKPGVRLTILGSVHLAHPGMFPLPDYILEAFDSADRLVVEVDLSRLTPGYTQKITMEAITLPKGTSLLELIPEQTSDRLIEILTDYPLPPGFAESLQPWALEQLLITMTAAREGIHTEQGIDTYFIQRAISQDKPIHELETLEEQLGYFQLIPRESHIASLDHTLESLEEIPGDIHALLQAWKAGDLHALEALIWEDWDPDRADDVINQILLTDRNHRWVNRIEAMIHPGGTEPSPQNAARGENLFVVVGFGHLVGEESLVELLVDRGFSVRSTF